jgi:hypothetical protein
MLLEWVAPLIGIGPAVWLPVLVDVDNKLHCFEGKVLFC